MAARRNQHDTTHIGSASRNVPEDFPQLLELLGSRPQPAVVWYGSPGAQDSSEPERVELSGRVLQNWAVKLIGLFREELEEVFEGSAQPVVLVDSAPHWKAAAVILAAGPWEQRWWSEELDRKAQDRKEPGRKTLGRKTLAGSRWAGVVGGHRPSGGLAGVLRPGRG